MENNLMKTSELAEYMGVSEIFIRKAVSAKKIPFVKLGRAVRFNKNDIDRHIQQNTFVPQTLQAAR